MDGTTRLLPDRCRPFAFPGGADTGSRLLDGPVVNLNVMLREGRADATVEMVRGSRVVEPVRGAYGGGADGPEAVLVVAVEGRPGWGRRANLRCGWRGSTRRWWRGWTRRLPRCGRTVSRR